MASICKGFSVYSSVVPACYLVGLKRTQLATRPASFKIFVRHVFLLTMEVLFSHERLDKHVLYYAKMKHGVIEYIVTYENLQTSSICEKRDSWHCCEI